MGMTEGWTNGPPAFTRHIINDGDYFLFRAAGEACLQNWDAAKTDLGLSAATDPASCLRPVVRTWVTATIAAHEADPGAKIVFEPVPYRFGPCPMALPVRELAPPFELAGPTPPGFPAYDTLAQGGSCGSLQTETEKWFPPASPDRLANKTYLLYHGAATACQLKWADATKDLGALNALDKSGLTCREAVVLRWLTNVVAAYDAVKVTNPTVDPKFQRDGSTTNPCPTP
jgi:hypothetical protein